MMWPPMAAWMATSNICLGISDLNLVTSSLPRCWEAERCTMLESASTLSPFTRMSSRAMFLELVVERAVAARHRLQAVEEIHHHLVERQVVGDHDVPRRVVHVGLRAALVGAKADHRADVFLRHEDLAGHDRLAELLD